MKDILAAGLPVAVGDLFFYPPTLKQLVNSTQYTLDYHMSVGLLLLDGKKITEDLGFPINLKQLNPFQAVKMLMLIDSGFQDQILAGLSFFFKEGFSFYEKEILSEEEYVLTEEDWEKLRDILITEFSVQGEQKEDYNFANEAARRFYEERVKKTRERVARRKTSQETISLGEQVFRVSVAAGVPISQIWGLTYYQFTSLLESTLIYESYITYIQLMASGNIDPKKARKQKHWIEPQ